MASLRLRAPAQPTRWSAALFFVKSRLLVARRSLTQKRAARFQKASALTNAPVVASSITPLRTETHPAEQRLQLGKIQNLRVAIRRLDGLEIPAGATFSFWQHVGHPARTRGFVEGRELREGCLVPSVGGGLCQLSNALYDTALQAGFEIVERHAHTRVLAGSLAEKNRDATVFWNYVDLRFRSRAAFRIEARLGPNHLRVFFKSRVPSRANAVLEPVREAEAIGSCASCGMHDCFLSLPIVTESVERTAFLVDAFWPEYDRWIQENRRAGDLLFVPWAGPKNYRWRTNGFQKIRDARTLTMLRALHSRRLAKQGGERQRMLMHYAERFAKTWAKKLPFEVAHVVVSQNLLPFLWETGALGGRTFDVLMTGYPIAQLHALLDRAAARHLDSRTLADFRASEKIARIEQEALAGAQRLLTSHRAVAQLFPEKTFLLDWEQKSVMPAPARDARTILFPASTLARKGACEVRAAALALDLRVILRGPVLESADFWSGVKVVAAGSPAVAVLPAFIEHQPRALLHALSAGLPVIATDECGLTGLRGVTVVPSGDTSALIAALKKFVSARNGV